MLTLNKIGIEFGANWLLRDASHQFKEGAITGLIGRNGAGKSSLLRVIAGQNLPSEGEVARPKESKLRYFHQDLLSFETETSVFEVAKDAFSDILAIHAELDQVLHEIENGNMDLDLWDKMAHLQAEWDGFEGDKLDARVYEILAGLGFKDFEVHQPYKNFSGGWRMRVLLAKMLLENPDILMMDEPTNHLDLPSIQWLENYLKTFPGICIVVSHDRFFLDRLVEEIVEISNQKLTSYPGNYAYFVAAKAERSDLQQKAFNNQQKYISDQQRFIDRFKAKASKAKQAQSKAKQLDKIELVDAPEEDTFALSMNFKVKVQSGREVLDIKHVTKSFGEKHILKNSSGVIERGDKIALIGANGLGKSTLLRIIAGTEPFIGERKVGHNVQSSHYAQHQLESLNLQDTILGEMAMATSDKTEVELRTILGCFMFTGDEVRKKIQVLSGGEKSRVALAKVLVSEANFLLLDEPTNHLDMQSISILIQALQNYQGTFIVISHDRHFLSQVANKIWYIEDRELKMYPGTYDEYAIFQEKVEAERLLNAPKNDKDKKAAKVETPKVEEVKVVVPKVEIPKVEIDYEAQKQQKNKLRKLQKEQTDLETEIEGLELEKKQLLLAISTPEVAANYSQLTQYQAKIKDFEKKIIEKTAKWEAVLEELEGM